MKSKCTILLTALAVLVSLRYATDVWVQPALAALDTAVGSDGFTLARGLSAVFTGVRFMLGLATLACVVLLASSLADVLIKRGWALAIAAGAGLALSSC